MKPLEKDELYQNLYGFLKARGVELNEGSYVARIQKGCSLLSDAINAGQHGVSRAKSQVDKKLDQLRQVIHEKTAPSRTATPPPRPPTAAAGAKSGSSTKTGKKRNARPASKTPRPSKGGKDRA